VTRGPEPQIAPTEILRAFLSHSDPAFVPSELAEELGYTTEAARHRMEKLVERGLLAKKKPGDQTVMYWITDEGEEYFFENTD